MLKKQRKETKRKRRKQRGETEREEDGTRSGGDERERWPHSSLGSHTSSLDKAAPEK